MEKDIIKGLVDFLILPKATLPIALLAVYAYKRVKEHFVFKKYRRTETLEKITQFFSKSDSRSSFIKEQLFHNHFGVLLSSCEIDFLLATKRPSFCLNRYMHALSLLEISGEPLTLKPKKGKSIIWVRRWYLLWYFLSGVAGILTLLNTNPVFAAGGPKVYAPWTIMVFSLLVFAWVSMDGALKASSAITLQREAGKV